MEVIHIDTSEGLLRSDGLLEAELAERIARSGAADHVIKQVFRDNGALASEVIARRNNEETTNHVSTD